MKYIKDELIENKKVILRLDLNVTIKDNKIIDDTKIRKSIPTIKYLLKNNNHVLIMSHLGKIKTEDDKDKNSLEIVSNRLEELIDYPVVFVNDTRGFVLENALSMYKLVMMENTRFEDLDGKKESKCSEELSKYWASLGDIFVNDAFGTTHRCHASTYGISKYIPSYYGLLINEELEGLEPIIKTQEKPFTVIMGGAKVDDKVALIKTLLNECDYLLVGGGIANTFLKANKYNIGNSLYSDEYVEEVSSLINIYKDKIYMPIDVVVKAGEINKVCNVNEIKEDHTIYDIGPETIELYSNIIKKSKTIFANGTMGLYEDEAYRKGTEGLYKVLENSNAIKVAGGGDAVASVNKLGYKKAFNFLSTGGGATLEYIANKKIAVFEGDK